jgi:hypothetical protein
MIRKHKKPWHSSSEKIQGNSNSKRIILLDLNKTLPGRLQHVDFSEPLRLLNTQLGQRAFPNGHDSSSVIHSRLHKKKPIITIK